jgi:hypothetical protein
MKVKALVSFAGAFSMHKGEVKECSDPVTLQDLLSAEYVEEAKEKQTKETKEEPAKGVKSNGNKQSKRDN